MTKSPREADSEFYFALGAALAVRDAEGGRMTTEQRIDLLCGAIHALSSNLPQPMRSALVVYAQNRLNMMELAKQMDEAGLLKADPPVAPNFPNNVTPFPGGKPGGGPDV